MSDESIRLNKFISESGFCSRREADQYIEEGRATINGRTAKMGASVKPGDKVAVDGETIKAKKPTDRPIYIALNKPVGVTTTTDPRDKNNIIDFVGFPKRIFPIGRLDNASEGLIFLTNNGDIINKILRAGNNHEKEYLVTVDKAITPEFITRMSNGVPIFDAVTKKCVVHQQSLKTFRIVLTQGLNRQIRRMCEALGYKVNQLKRVRIMNVKLGDLPVGHWRHLTKEEVEGINKLVASSSKTEEASYNSYEVLYGTRKAGRAAVSAEKTDKLAAVTGKPKTGSKTKDESINPKSASLRKKGAAKKGGGEKRFSESADGSRNARPAGHEPDKKSYSQAGSRSGKPAGTGPEKRTAAAGKKTTSKPDVKAGKSNESRPKSARPPKNPKGRQR